MNILFNPLFLNHCIKNRYKILDSDITFKNDTIYHYLFSGSPMLWKINPHYNYYNLE
jgi:hypothetical protein